MRIRNKKGQFKKGYHPSTEFEKGHKINLGRKRPDLTMLPQRFRKGQIPWNKSRKWPEISGKNHPKWKGGIRKSNGYIWILKPDHLKADNRGYVKRANLVVEESLKRFLTKQEIVHHINEITNDDRLENLYIFPSRAKHFQFHCSKMKRNKLGQYEGK